MRLSYVILSNNRKEALLKTLARLPKVTPLPPKAWEVWVVDDASTDGSADAVAEKYSRAHLICNIKTEGQSSCNSAISQCSGEYIILIKADSHPLDHRSVSAALEKMDQDPSIAAMVGRSVLPTGETEGPDFPGMLFGGATCFRKSALEQVGAFSTEFPDSAGEYDLGFRLWGAGYRIDRCEQFLFRHEKIEIASTAMDDRLALQSHLIVAQRHLPPKLAAIYWADWKLRFSALADHNGNSLDAFKGLWTARKTWLKEMRQGRTPLADSIVENIFHLREQSTAVGKWARANQVWRVVIADFGMNIYATYNACISNGLQVRCITDATPALVGHRYRGLPIIPISRAFHNGGGIEGVVISNINPGQIDARVESIRHHFHGPILRLWNPAKIANIPQSAAA